MSMGKGNFFKKDIKKKKKERKERGLKQRILDQKKKVEEKIHHVVDAVTEVKKPTEPEPVVEQTVKEPKHQQHHNDKYKITINQNTLERIKNYFR